jgi:hypothetical protein
MFVPDVEGFSTVTAEIVPAHLEAAVRAAEAACPEHAITTILVAAEDAGSSAG